VTEGDVDVVAGVSLAVAAVVVVVAAAVAVAAVIVVCSLPCMFLGEAR
jgi:hypothetical protein